ncbi:hypothetical protein FHG87_013737, partial [Trinorchestia longiramus]
MLFFAVLDTDEDDSLSAAASRWRPTPEGGVVWAGAASGAALTYPSAKKNGVEGDPNSSLVCITNTDSNNTKNINSNSSSNSTNINSSSNKNSSSTTTNTSSSSNSNTNTSSSSNSSSSNSSTNT